MKQKALSKSNYNQHTVAQIVKPHFDQEPQYGNNPTVFSYSVLPPDDNGLIGGRMQFFENVKFICGIHSNVIMKPNKSNTADRRATPGSG